MVQGNALALLANGNISTLLEWFDRLPDDAVKKHPRLSVYCVWALMLAGRLDNIEKYISIAEEAARSRNELVSLQGDIAAVRSYAASRQGDMGRLRLKHI